MNAAIPDAWELRRVWRYRCGSCG